MRKFLIYLSAIAFISSAVISCDGERDNNDETKVPPKQQPQPF